MKSTLRKLLLILIVQVGWSTLSAQTSLEVIGKVVDETGESLPGVTIVVKGVSKGTTTDLSGNYKIMVTNPQNVTLVYSYVGMVSLEEKVGTRKIINVTMKNSSVELNEVVAIGYGTMRRKDLTGSVTSANVDDIAKVPVANIAQALAGRMAGVNVTQSDGDVNNSSISIRVRGGISLTQDNEPLYVIDGFPSDASAFQVLNPSDIESIDVLKDASSTAIYGARGANGVVVISTKGGKEGKASISYEGYFGVRNLSKKMELLSIPEFIKLSYERLYRSETSDLSSFTRRYGAFADIDRDFGDRQGVDWQDETFRTAYSQSHKLTVGGGTKDLKYSLSYARQKEDGLMIESGLIKDNIRMKLDHRLTNFLRVDGTINFTNQKTYGSGTSSGGTNFSKMSSILMFIPTLGHLLSDDLLRDIPNLDTYDPTILDEAGNTLQNPAASARAELNNKEMRIFSANGGVSVNLMKNLMFKNTTGMLYRTQRNEIYNGENSINAKRTSINGSIQNVEVGTIQTSNTLLYDWMMGASKFNALLGQEYISTWNRSFKTSVTNLPNDDMLLNDLSLGLPSPSESYFSDDDKMLSFFGRLYWNMKERYMLTLTARYDGSSKFGKDHKWGFFPSGSFAWRLSEEPLIKSLGVFSDLKLRLGYGMAGNNRIPSYSSLAIWASQTTPSNNGSVPGYYPNQMPNDELRWEANRTLNFGLDLGFFNQRLTFNPELYVNRSSDLLLNATIPMSSGHTSMIRNIGATENRGIDLTINSVNIRTKNFEWTTSLTLSHNQNKIVELAGEQSFLQSSNFGYSIKDYVVEVGQPIGQMWGFKTAGLYQVGDFESYDAATDTWKLKPGVPYQSNNLPKPGYWKYENIDGETDLDANGNPLITEKDRTVIGSSQPVVYGGLNNTFTYKNFDLSIFLNYSIGNDVLNATRLWVSLYGWTNKNTLASNDSRYRWMTIDTDGRRITDPARLAEINQGKTVAQWDDMENANQQIHSWGVEDASFLRISNITLGYTFPIKMLKPIKLSNLRLYMTANNLYCFTKYSGYDPEVSTRNATGLTPGVDWSAYPRSSSFVVGLSIGL